jgi:hypothetical protein
MKIVVDALSSSHENAGMPLGTGTVQFSRTRRPRWMTFGGVAALPVLGAGVVLLCQRRVESFTVMVAPRHDGCSVAFGAGAPAEVIEAIAEMLAPPEIDLDFDDWIAPDDESFRTVVDEVVAPREPAYAPLRNERTIADPGSGSMSPTGTVAELPSSGTIADLASSGTIAELPSSGTIAEFPASSTVAETPGLASSGTIAERPVVDEPPQPPQTDSLETANGRSLERPVTDAAGWPEPRVERRSLPRPELPFAAPVPAPASDAGAPAGTVPLPPPAPVSWAVFFDTGEIAVIEGAVLVGREPSASTLNERTVVIDDPDKSVSRNHFSISRSGNDLTIVDRGSSNGTAVLRRGSLIDVRVGDSTPLEADDEIIFGNRRAKLHRR